MAILEVKLNEIDDNPFQPRSSYPRTKIEELAYSMKEHGQIHACTARQVDGRYQLAEGHMRKRAQAKNFKEDPKKYATLTLNVRELNDEQMALLALEENMRRQDITPIDVARQVELCVTKFKKTETEMAKKLNMTQPNVSNMRRVLRLPKEILDKIEEGKINFTMARELLVFEGKIGVGEDSNWSRTEKRQVSKGKDAKWLMLNAISGVGGSYGPAATVDGIKKAIYSTCSSHFRHLEGGGGGYYGYGNNHNPLFDTRAAGCLKCESMIRANETKSNVLHYCTNQKCWDQKQEKHIRDQAAAAKKKMEEDIAARINTEEMEKATKPAGKKAIVATEDISQEIPTLSTLEEAADFEEEMEPDAIEAEAMLDEDYIEQASEFGVSKEVASGIPTEQRASALKTWGNFQLDPRECCCRECVSAGICDGTPKRLTGAGDKERWTCKDQLKLWAVEKVAAKAKKDLPAAFEGLDKDAAGTRAEILDIRNLRTSSYGSDLKSGHVWLQKHELEKMDNPTECLETCTRGFHYGYDSGSSGGDVLHICTDPKCVSRKKGAFTREQNARGNAKKKAEMAAIKEAVTATTTLDKPRLILILLTQLYGKYTRPFYQQGESDGEKLMAKLLKIDVEKTDKKQEAFEAGMQKLSEEELAKVVVEYMLRSFAYDGDIQQYKVRTTGLLNSMGIGINIPKKEAKDD